MDDIKKFKDMEIGEEVIRPVLIRSLTPDITKAGVPYVIANVTDGDSIVNIKLFDFTMEQMIGLRYVPDSTVTMKLFVKEFNGNKDYKCLSIGACDLTAAAFIKKPDIDPYETYDWIIETLVSVSDDLFGSYTPLAALAVEILSAYKEEFIRSAGAYSVHHNTVNGLIYHTYRMMKSALAISSVYKNLDKELLLCGTALHDIGKICDYDTSMYGSIEMTSDFTLFGHIYRGAQMVERFGKKDNYSPEKVRLLTHMILSHHGMREYGAVVTPAIPEAMVLHHIDTVDANMYIFEEKTASIKPGETTKSINGTVYRPVMDY